MSQGMQAASRRWKKLGAGFYLRASRKEHGLANTFDFNYYPVRPVSDF